MVIGLLECDHVADRFRHIAGDYRQMFTDLLGRYAPDLQLKFFDVCNGDLPSSVNSCDAYICTGSRHSVYDDIDWVHSLKNFVRRLREAERPFIGICFGHQLLAEALGGRVARAEQGWGVGIHRMDVLHSELWMQPQQASCKLQYMHQDQVKLLPDGSVVLGRSDHCRVAMFRIGDKILGIQGHPEFTAAYIEALLNDRYERIGAGPVEKALAGLGQTTDEQVVTQWMAKFILNGRFQFE